MGDRRVDRTPPTSDWSPITAELADREANAFIHLGEAHDPDRRYLTGMAGPDRPLGLLCLAASDGQQNAADEATARTVCVVPPPVDRTRQVRLGVDEVVDADHRQLGRAIRDKLVDAPVDGPVLASSAIPHDAALYVERAGYELRSTDAVAAARRRKADWERAELTDGQRAAHAGLQRARDQLTAAGGDDPGENDTIPTAERVRRAIDAEIIDFGAAPAGGTIVRHGDRAGEVAGAAGGKVVGRVPTDEPIVIRCSPRTPAGYHGSLTRTIVVDSDGGWDRRAHVAVTNARRAALAVLDAGAGASIDDVRTEAIAELTAYGFGHDEANDVHVGCYGVGLTRYERPTGERNGTLEEGDVVALEVGLTNYDRGSIELSDLVAIEENDSQLLVDVPTTL